MKRSVWFRQLLPAAAVLTAAIPAFASSREKSPDLLLTDEFHAKYSFTLEGTVRVEDTNSSLKVREWDRDEVRVDAVKKATDQACLDQTRILVDSGSNQISIRTARPETAHQAKAACSGEVKIEFTLTIPKHVHLLVGSGERADEVIRLGSEII